MVAFRHHPLTVLDPVHAPAALQRPDQKIEWLKHSGVDHVFAVPFTKRLAHVKAEPFLRDYLVRRMNVRWLVVGANFNFGHDREGNVEYLGRVGPRWGCQVKVVPAFRKGTHRVSSTHIRQLVQKGRMEEAARFLGRAYEIRGRVEEGNCLGRTGGFPTANIGGITQLLPGRGVYIVRIQLSGQPVRWGVANVGVRPTVARSEKVQERLEVHVLDWSGRAYGRPAKVWFFRRIRLERKFPSWEFLVKQIRRDERLARAWIRRHANQ